jgi:hypothetical protein
MPAAKGTRPPNAGKGRRAGVPNKITTELKDMILSALEGAGGVEYLKARALDTPGPFLALVGKVLPLQVTGGDGKPLIPPGGVTFVIQQQKDSENRT